MSEVALDLNEYSYDNLEAHLGKELSVSDWLLIDQNMIDQFAECTGDRQWIHVDVERAAKESPFGGTIAHGFLILSLIAKWNMEGGAIPEDITSVINYGSDQTRFLSPVLAGKKVRNRMSLESCDPKGKSMKLVKVSNVVEIEGEEKPALKADTLILLVKK